MPANKVKGLGTLLTVAAAAIGNRVSITGPSQTVNIKDVSTLDDTHVRKLPTIPDSGDLSFSIFYDPHDTGHTSLFTLAQTPALVTYTLVMPTVTTVATFTFSGILSKFDANGMEVDNYIGADCTIAIDGAIVQT